VEQHGPALRFEKKEIRTGKRTKGQEKGGPKKGKMGDFKTGRKEGTPIRGTGMVNKGKGQGTRGEKKKKICGGGVGVTQQRFKERGTQEGVYLQKKKRR